MPNFQIDLLDVGAIEYGDSILIQGGGLTALIDGGKSASGSATASQVLGESISHKPIDDQIRNILGHTELDLLIVTHCHSDHIGCLPKLFAEERLSCKFALLADPNRGYGLSDVSPPVPDFDDMTPLHKLRLALNEEPISSTNPDQVLSFIEDSAREFSDYQNFFQAMTLRLGPNCVAYKGTDETDSPGLKQLLTAMAPLHLKIYGPSADQLIGCAGFLEGRSGDDLDRDMLEALTQNRNDLVSAYFALQPEPAQDFSSADAADEVSGNNNAVNNQSIVLSVGDGTRKALLTGDMQFFAPQLSDPTIAGEMAILTAAILRDAPFSFVKLSHHGARNGQDLKFLQRLGASFFGICTGSRSAHHPTPNVLTALQTLRTEKSASWIRVDINGLCSYTVIDGEEKLSVTRNQLNDATTPALRSGDSAEIVSPAKPPQLANLTGRPTEATVSQTSVASAADAVEVRVRIPKGISKVTVTIEVAPSPLS